MTALPNPDILNTVEREAPEGCLAREHGFYAISAVFASLERTISDSVSDDNQSKGTCNKSQIDLPAEPNSGTIVHAAHGKLNQRTSGPKTIGDSVAVLIGQNQNLLVDIQDFSERVQNRHNNDGLSAAGNDKEIEKCDKYEDDEDRQNRAPVFQKLRHGVHDRIDDTCLIHQDNHGLCQTDRKCCGEHTHSTGAEQLACLTGGNPEKSQPEEMP